MITGKGYFFFVDKVNRKRPQGYVDNKLEVLASNLCSEICLHSDIENTFTCVLASMNLAKWDEWKDTYAVYWATLFLDCVAQEFIELGKSIPGLEKAVNFTKNGRALGLGQCGLHTLMMMKRLPFEGLEAHVLSSYIAKYIQEEAIKASMSMSKERNEPLWCSGTGRINTHLTAIAPTKSTALIMGGISEGINPDPAMVFTQTMAGGEVQRVNPILLKLMKDRNVYDSKHINEIEKDFGSVQGVDWLSDKEKEVFKTAFEMDMNNIVRMASVRQKYVCQSQSLNLFFSSDTPEKVISSVHKKAFLDENINSLYYCYSKTGVKASEGGCVACQ